jgi:hypothetical protein
LGQQINSRSQLLNLDLKIKKVSTKKNNDMAAKYEESIPDPFLIGSWTNPVKMVKITAPFQLYSDAMRANAIISKTSKYIMTS